jgi:hypothetical protein
MSTQIASRLTRLEQNIGAGSRRFVVVEDQKALEAARAFLQCRPDVDMDRITFVVTGLRPMAKTPNSGYAQLAGWRSFGRALKNPPKAPSYLRRNGA